ncbi:MAG: nitronate monooxygenase family protein [Dehalococcoidia bacterium]|nr:nitronate monooxygenase family protein [Dehalococcoidia bacterium]
MLKTRVTELLGITHPVIQSGMQWVSRASLAAAVSNAGGLGIISALTFATPGDLATEIRTARSLTDKPFGVNVTMLPTLRPIDIDSYVATIIDEGVRIVETAGRSPEPYMSRLKSAGIKVIHKCTGVRYARSAERLGCDAISIDGFECAGHPGEQDVTSLVLIPLTVDAVKVPVIASGGFADGRGLAAALSLGADAVNMGTRFMATQEAPINPKVKDWLVRSAETDTILIMRAFQNTSRVLKNPISEQAYALEKHGATIKEMASLISGLRGKELLETGDLDRGILACGQVVGLINAIPTVAELLQQMISTAEQIIRERLPSLVIA